MPFRVLTVGDNQFTERAVEWLTERISTYIAQNGTCTIGLSGGSTPGSVYKALGKSPVIDWSDATVFLADERYVSADNLESNQHLIRSTLLEDMHINALPQLLFPNTELPTGECVQDYADTLDLHLEKGRADILILGMGEDGHIASLFPPLSDDALKQNVLHTTTDRFAVHDRISIGLPLIRAARSTIILLKGEPKKRTWEDMIASSEDERRWPLKAVLEGEDVAVVFG